ncbi:MAG: PilZ domain-containing protein [Sphingomonadales bacterium]|nr:MAG: PilZ domain-containing protein [Sphingomonadales bacterium]
MHLAHAEKLSLRRMEAQDRRKHRRVNWAVRVRGLTGSGEEFTCTTVDVCAGGLRINLARPLSEGENLVLYIDNIGRVEGVVARVLNEIGYAVQFTVPPRKREKIADMLTWLINKDSLGLVDEREGERRPGGGQIIARYNGVSIACAVADVSIFGVALKTAGPRPMIGDRVQIGERAGTCVRYIDGGFAIDYRTLHGTDI